MEAASFPFFFKKERYSVQPDPDGVYGGWGTPGNNFNAKNSYLCLGIRTTIARKIIIILATNRCKKQ
ncbi:hypothetical protein OA85_03835 [Flavobacterium sp. AED]|nr:hypothetical protein OA85_03835 [Flavobacterium sp. AED]